MCAVLLSHGVNRTWTQVLPVPEIKALFILAFLVTVSLPSAPVSWYNFMNCKESKLKTLDSLSSNHHLTSLALSFLACKMGIRAIPHSFECCGNWLCEEDRTRSGTAMILPHLQVLIGSACWSALWSILSERVLTHKIVTLQFLGKSKDKRKALDPGTAGFLTAEKKIKNTRESLPTGLYFS